MSSVKCVCSCGDEHSRQIPQCESTHKHPWADLDWYSRKDAVLQCDDAAGHEGNHYAWYDIGYGIQWVNEPVKAT
jgi:hypothetical protein